MNSKILLIIALAVGVFSTQLSAQQAKSAKTTGGTAPTTTKTVKSSGQVNGQPATVQGEQTALKSAKTRGTLSRSTAAQTSLKSAKTRGTTPPQARTNKTAGQTVPSASPAPQTSVSRSRQTRATYPTSSYRRVSRPVESDAQREVGVYDPRTGTTVPHDNRYGEKHAKGKSSKYSTHDNRYGAKHAKGTKATKAKGLKAKKAKGQKVQRTVPSNR